MNMKQFRYALVLADEGSFARAAEVLGVSQPNLSQYIKKIEQQVGMELFDRTGGDIRLTDAGRVYIEAGEKILDIEHQMQNSFSDISENKSGSVIVGTSPYRSAAMMPKVAAAFREKYPGMVLVIEEMTTGELLEAAERGLFDLCLTVLPVDDRAFSYEKIMEEELILAVPASYQKIPAETVPGRKYPAIDATEIDGEAFVMITESQVMQKALEHLCSDYGIEVRKASVVKSLEAQISMVRAGVGMALVPTGIENFCTSDEVTFYSFREKLPRREVAAIWRKDRRLSEVARDLLEMMKK